jgi:hypothetical protein
MASTVHRIACAIESVTLIVSAING